MLLQAIFLYFAAVIAGSSFMVITRRNPVHSVLWLLLMFFHVAGLFILVQAEFLAAVQIIVYAGAILVLYLFVIMLLNVEKERMRRAAHSGWLFYSLIGLLVLIEVCILIGRAHFNGAVGPYTVERVATEGNSQLVGQVLYTDFLFPFEIASVILLMAMVGAIVLAKKKLPR